VAVAGATTTLIVGLLLPQAAAIPAASSAAVSFQILIPTPPHNLDTGAKFPATVGALPALDGTAEP
jgi:hypothetical protein